MDEIYLDSSATTRPYSEVIDRMVAVLRQSYGNPSSLHSKGLEGMAVLNTARIEVAQALGVNEDEVYFTSSGTEADNLAILGTSRAGKLKSRHIVTTAVEHAAVTKSIRQLKRRGWKVDYIPAPGGHIDTSALEDAITAETTLVSVMLVNNEVGSIFPLPDIRQIIERKDSQAVLHCDAVQGFGKIPFTAQSLGADLISISSHKIHGPKGAGALWVKSGIKLHPRIFGGGQEKGLRSGTEATSAIAGFGEAVRITFSRMESNRKHINKLKEYCLASLVSAFPDIHINSPPDGIPHIINVSLPGVRNKNLTRYLSDHNIYVSSAAACKSNHTRGPSILESMGITREMAYSALRISFCAENTIREIDELIRWISEYRRTVPPVKAYLPSITPLPKK